jgi:hypothetical protein
MSSGSLAPYSLHAIRLFRSFSTAEKYNITPCAESLELPLRLLVIVAFQVGTLYLRVESFSQLHYNLETMGKVLKTKIK